MTTHADHRVWQDVYHRQWNGTALYIKFQQAGEYFVVSFKELCHGKQMEWAALLSVWGGDAARWR
ncbi:MAG: type II toxin-antitoxin system MqsR family toxin [Gammaproteobacteria bacterium]|nr:type II toxin-antitoxin system MqsR family toxin [Gammaproteobacteria bacterium]MBU1977842.1 type II toxin-antitoxin system MqsR family toxin [Gammaproteobacteria bacterium]